MKNLSDTRRDQPATSVVPAGMFVGLVLCDRLPLALFSMPATAIVAQATDFLIGRITPMVSVT
jgi:hypothetical protein